MTSLHRMTLWLKKIVIFFWKLENLKINAPLFEPDCYSSHVYFLSKKWKNSLYSLMISQSTETRSRLFTKIMSLRTSQSMILNRKNIIWLYALTSIYRIYIYMISRKRYFNNSRRTLLSIVLLEPCSSPVLLHCLLYRYASNSIHVTDM